MFGGTRKGSIAKSVCLRMCTSSKTPPTLRPRRWPLMKAFLLDEDLSCLQVEAVYLERTTRLCCFVSVCSYTSC